jgi:hypothetical protein
LGEQRIAKKDLRVMDLGVCEDAVQWAACFLTA